MDGQIIVTTETLVSQADEVAKLIADTENSFRDLKSLVNSTGSYWVGEAGDANRQKYNKQEPNIDVAIRRLREHVKDLKAMAGVYDTTERAAETEAENLISEVIS